MFAEGTAKLNGKKLRTVGNSEIKNKTNKSGNCFVLRAQVK